ncbi:ATP-binding protein [Cellulomonas sp. NPDC089187]|uniref:sensor histidine kinase n=1 Tax=Cellulomonas sp. NPDC089187 TaxID=3154970 RepID=UPI00341DBF9E
MSEAASSRRPRGRWTLRRRLVAVVLILLAAVAAVMGVVSTVALRSSLIGQIDDRLSAASQRAQQAPQRFQEDAPDPSAPRPSTQTPPALGLPGQDVGTVNVYQFDGITLSGYLDDNGDSQELTDAQLDLLLSLTPDGDPITLDLPDLGSYRAVAVTNADGDLSVTALPLADATATVDAFLAVEIAVGVVGLLVGGGLATVLLRRELRPLDRVAATATRVAEMPLARGAVQIAERVPEADTDPGTEVGKVGSALNRMLGHVESALSARHESETQVRRFVADASHELRTPLASIRGYAELVQRLPEPVPQDARRAMDRVESEATRMTGLVEDMLLLARLDAGRDLDQTEVDLAGLAVDAVADAHVAGPDHVWHLDLGEEDAEPPSPVIGDEHRLRQVLLNLLSNARVHTPPGSTVTVSVRDEGTQVVLRVRDDGPGIAEPLRSRLFERFTRGDESRNRAAGSTGLGLAIVHAVVTAHSGTIEVDSTPGATTFTVRLPRATAEA